MNEFLMTLVYVLLFKDPNLFFFLIQLRIRRQKVPDPLDSDPQHCQWPRKPSFLNLIKISIKLVAV